MYTDGLFEYMVYLWNIIYLSANAFFVTWIGMRGVSFFIVFVSLACKYEVNMLNEMLQSNRCTLEGRGGVNRIVFLFSL